MRSLTTVSFLIRGAIVALLLFVAAGLLFGPAAFGSGEPSANEVIAGGCTPVPLTPTETVEGTLATTDCWSSGRGALYYADQYSFTASAGEEVSIGLSASGFNPWVYLIGPDGTVVAENGTNLSSTRIPSGTGFLTLPSSGTYIVDVTSWREGQTGTYILECVQPDAPCRSADMIILPTKGGNTGSVSTVIYGAFGQFADGATATLTRSGEPDVVGDPVGVASDGSRIATTFDLSGSTLGAWDVAVINADGTTFTLPSGFTIEEGRAAQVWVDIVGRDVIRADRQQTYTILFGNRGNVNALGVPLWIGGIPEGATWDLGFEVTPPPLSDIDWTQVPTQIETEGEIRVPLFIPVIPPDFTGALEISLAVSAGQEPFELHAWLNPCYFESPLDPDVVQCGLALFEEALNVVGFFGVPVHCTRAAGELLGRQVLSAVDMGVDAWAQETSLGSVLFDVTQMHVDILEFGILCAGEVSPGVAQLVNAVQFALQAVEVYEECREFFSPVLERFLRVLLVQAFDPNEKVGSSGAGPQQYISGEEPLRYSILFENLETATAPAQEVVITDRLDPATMDNSTFSLGSISFGDRTITPPFGLSSFVTEVDLRPDNNLLVKIEAGLDVASGVATWRFTSLDPLTGEPPEDPLAGFLPPNVTPPQGDGSVLFTVRPRDSLSTGTEVRNRAAIVFDVNAPIDTSEWLNTLDNTGPSSQVLPLPSTQDSTTFEVQWSGADVGSGIMDYSVLVSENGGPYAAWLTNTADTSAIFDGESDKTYAFYSIARDWADNTEEPPTVADMTTTTLGTVSPTPTRTLTRTPTSTPTMPVVAGDVNCDGTIDAVDAAFILQFSAGLLGSLPCAGGADVNHDGVTNPLDAALILQFAAGLIPSLPP
ncbi:MAG: hypothetical protein IH865_02655 [Chloroflexi bacterium]|nr:hypothetical protein [Chloroflexota bacterium]